MTLKSATACRPLSIVLLATAAIVGAGGSLSAQTPQLVQSIPDPNDPVERLGRYIRVLASSPRDLDALLGAGQAALDVGDANAALGFYARAEGVSPSSGQVKAGLGSSLVMIERPNDALRLFAEAVSMGVPEGAVARDRGLAYDLRGDSRRAQRDYALALLRGRDDELIRRYALSLGISGDRAGAMAMLDPLLRKQDQGAWRARAFILAMNGDVQGANSVARQLMVPAMANAMSPLLSRLASLNPAERAHAVNFGTVPADGTQLAVQTGDPYLGTAGRPLASSPSLVSGVGIAMPTVTSGDTGLIPSGEPLGRRAVDITPVRVAQADSLAPRRRPGAGAPTPTIPAPAASTVSAKPSPGFTAAPDAVSQARRVGDRVGTRIGAVDPANPALKALEESTRIVRVDAATLPPPEGPRPVMGPTTPTRSAQDPANVTPSSPPSVQISRAELPPSAASTTPVFEVPPATAPLVRTAPPTIPPSTTSPTATAPVATSVGPGPSSQSVTLPVPTSSTTASARLAGLLEGIEREQETAAVLPNAAELRAARAAAKKKMAQLAAQAAAEEVAKREAAEKAAAAKRNPPRVWVQVATGRNDSGLGLTLKRIRSDNEAALKGLSGWSAPYKATNRILVGPMKSAAAARELVAKLGKNGVSAMTFSSDAGEEVEKIAVK